MNRVMKRSVSVLLSLLMVLSAVSSAGVVFPLKAEAQTPAAEGETVTVVACSDYQYGNTDYYHVGATSNAGGEIVVGNIVSKMKSAGIEDIDGFLCAGDYDYDQGNNADTAGGIASLTNAVAPIAGDDTDYVFIQGNHDPQSTTGGTYPSGDNDPADGAYGVFVINERDYQYGGYNNMNETATLTLMETLRRYLNNKIAVDYTAPIFVISHVPLHFSMRTKDEGDNIYAKDIFDVVNEAGEQGLNIIYLYGHNHGKGWDDYLGGSKVFLGRGDSINIAEHGSRTAYTEETLNFVYMNAGFTGYYERWNTSSGAAASASYDLDDLTMTSFQITDSTVTISRYNNAGATDLKKAGVYNYYKNEQSFSPAYETNSAVVGSYTMNLTPYVEDTEYEIAPVIESDPDVLAGLEKNYPRITSLDQLVDGGTYIMICTTTFQNNYNNPVNSNMNFLMTHDIVGAQNSNHGLGRAQLGSGFAHSETSIEGAYGACEWTFRKSGNAWRISTDGQEITFVKSGNNGAYNVELSTSGTSFTFSQPRTNVNEFLIQASLNNQTVFFDANKDLSYTYAYAGSYNRATFAIYGAKKIPSTTAERYELQNVSSAADLEENATYLILNGNNAITPANGYKATPVTVENEAGIVCVPMSHPTLEWRWVSTGGGNHNFRQESGTQRMQIGEGVTNTYAKITANNLQNGSTYIIVASAGGKYYAVTSNNDSDNTNLARQEVSVNGNTLTTDDDSVITWKFTQTTNNTTGRLDNNGKYLVLAEWSVTTSTATNNAEVQMVDFNANHEARIKRRNQNYYLRHNNDVGQLWETATQNDGTRFAFYKQTSVSDGTVHPALGTDANTRVELVNSNGEILLRVVKGTQQEYLALDTAQATPCYVFDENGSDFHFYKKVEYTIPEGVLDISVVPGQSVVGEYSGVSASAQEATVYVGASARTYTGLYFNITTGNTRDIAQVPIKIGDLIDYTGHQNVAQYCDTVGTYTGLGAYYSPIDGAWLSDLILHVIQKEDYPEYPNEGSVKVGKSAGAPNFLTNGVTQVELTATGVPMSPGIDIVLMLDTSSSMSETINGVTRMTALRNSVDALIATLAQPNETTGLMPDITMAIADFNGYYDPTDGQQSYISSTDTANGSMVYTSSNTTYHSHVLTGPNAGSEATNTIFNNDAFIDIGELAQNFHGSDIKQYAGTNYDAAFQTIYKLFEARQAYNAAMQEDRDTVVIFMSDGGPFQYNFFSAQSTSDLWNDWQIGTYDDATATGLANLKRDFPSDRWYFYNGPGNSNRFADAVKGDPDKYYTIPTKDANSYSGDRNSDGFCDICGKCTRECVDHDHDGLCDNCGHIDQCSHTDANNDGYCDVAGCGECMNGCEHYQYMTEVAGLGATMYSIVFCPAVNQNITLESLEHVIESVASDSEKVYSAYTPSDLTDAFLDIASKYVQAGTEAYFVDTMGPAYDIQLARVYTKNNGEFEQTYTLDPAPTIEVKKHIVYTRADYANGVIDDYNKIGTRTGRYETIETVTFNDDGTQGFSDQIDNGRTNILIDDIIYAKHFIYNNTPSPVMVDTDGDGVEDYLLASETFYWTIGIIENTEFALTYWLYLTGSMEGTREPGSFQTNSAAILYYNNYLEHECWQEVYSPVQAWEAANITYEFYLVDDLGNPVNSAGEVVPFANRVLIGNMQTETFNLNSNDTQTASDLFQVAAADLPDYYTLYSPDAKFAVALYSGDDYNTSRAIITDDVNVYGSSTAVTTYYYDQYNTYNQAGDVPHNKVYDYANTHVAFGVKRVVTIVPDSVVIDYGLPVKVHVLLNDIALYANTKISAIGTGLAEGAELNKGYPEPKLAVSGKELNLAHGTAAVVNGDSQAETFVKYTPFDMVMSTEETFYYEVYMNNHYYYSTVTVIPAANIYYEDSFLNFIDGSGANEGYVWKTAGETYEDVYQAEDRPGTFALAAYDANNVYGNDAAYDDSVATYSLGSSKYVTVDARCKITESIAPRATFTFCGTGFDVISVTSVNTGAVTVTVRDHETGAVVNKQVVNTYYGYSYGRLYIDNIRGEVTLRSVDDEGNENIPLYNCPVSESMYAKRAKPDELLVRVNGRIYSSKNYSDETAQYNYAYGWLVEANNEGVLYQIPVLKTKGLPYGTYDVTLQPRYASAFDLQNSGKYEVYIDGIRTYDPAGTGDNMTAVVAEAYEDDKERNPLLTSVRDTIISDKEGFLRETEGVGEKAVGGTIMVDGMFVTAGSATALADLAQSGPNNEMYLAQYQAIAFRPAVTAGAELTSFQLGMKVAITEKDQDTGKEIPSNAAVRIIISDVKRQMIRQIYSLTVSGSAEQFYDLSPLLSWTKEEGSSQYVSDYDVVILNDSDVVLSLTAFKTTFSSRAKTEETEDELDAPEMMVVSTKRTLSFAKSAVQQVLTSADTSTLDIQWLTDDLTVGATAVLTVTTSSEITSVMIGNTEITEFTENEDGTRTWSYEFTVVETGENAYDVILKDSFGRTSETFSTSVPLAPVETEPEVTEPTGNEDSQDPDVTEPTGNEDLQDPAETEPTGNEDSQDPAETEPEDAGTSSTGGFFKKLLSLLAWLLMIIETILSFFG